MQNKTVVESHVEELFDYVWLRYEKDGEHKFIGYNKDSVKEAAEHFGVSEKLIELFRDAFDNFAEAVIETVKSDLEDVWEVSNCAHNMAIGLAELHGINVHEDSGNGDESPEGGNWESCEDCEDNENCPEYKEHQEAINKLFTPPNKKSDEDETNA